MAEPFERRAASSGGVLGRLRGGRGRASAIREIEELLAGVERLTQVPPERVEAVARRHGLDLEARLRTPCLGLYRRFFEHCLLDHSVSEAERAELSHLRSLLRLSAQEVARVHAEAAGSIYGDAIDNVLEDHRLDSEEEDFLRKLRDELDLPADLAERLYSEGESRARRRFLERSVRRDDFLLSSRDVTLELSGVSEAGLEAAVRGAVEETCRAVDGVHWVEVSRIGVEVEGGRIARWHVKLQAKREAED